MQGFPPGPAVVLSGGASRPRGPAGASWSRSLPGLPGRAGLPSSRQHIINTGYEPPHCTANQGADRRHKGGHQDEYSQGNDLVSGKGSRCRLVDKPYPGKMNGIQEKVMLHPLSGRRKVCCLHSQDSCADSPQSPAYSAKGALPQQAPKRPRYKRMPMTSKRTPPAAIFFPAPVLSSITLAHVSL